MKNKVAKFLKVYAILNALMGIALGVYIWGEKGIIIGLSIFISSMIILGIGEGLKLLQDIKNNTKKVPEKEPVSEVVLPIEEVTEKEEIVEIVPETIVDETLKPIEEEKEEVQFVLEEELPEI